ncbi:hypothetical protein [Microbacterium enclense]|uniref:hypothetical protein n=1 Tax=Microbacterium enclense TaxID=993073 RepID=UPI003F815777
MSTFDEARHARDHGGRFTENAGSEQQDALAAVQEGVAQEARAKQLEVGDTIRFQNFGRGGWTDVDCEVVGVQIGIDENFRRVVDIDFMEGRERKTRRFAASSPVQRIRAARG